MKTKLLLLTSVFAFLLYSCNSFLQFDKRRYRPGYYLNAKNENSKQDRINSKSSDLKEQPEQILVLKEENDPQLILSNTQEMTGQGKVKIESSEVNKQIESQKQIAKQNTTSSPTIFYDDGDEAIRAKHLAIASLIALYIFLPVGIVLAFIAKNRAKAIMDKHGKDEDYVGKKDAEFAFRFAKGVLIGSLVLTIVSIIAIIALVNALNSAGCFIATMVYKSYDAPEVLVLRKFRDETLKKNLFGRMFIAWYYSFSPLFVRIFKNNKEVNLFCKWILDKMVARLKRKYESQVLVN